MNRLQGLGAKYRSVFVSIARETAAPEPRSSAVEAQGRSQARTPTSALAALRPVPAKVDQHIVVGCPLFCPHCEGEVRVTGKTDQYQMELPRPGAVTRHFEIHVGRCTSCGRIVQGRPRLQTSDAKEVGTVQLGPQLIATAAHMNEVEGLSYGRVCASSNGCSA